MRRERTLPAFLQPCLWSYDVRRLNRLTHAETIITQVLNYGDWRMVRWALHAYEPSTIRRVISHPRRGHWFPQALNLWTKMYRIRLPRWLATVAVRELDPARCDWAALGRYRRQMTEPRRDGPRRAAG